MKIGVKDMKAVVIGAGLAALLTAAGGCASLSHKKDDQALAAVKKIAVVAFMVDEPASASLGFNLGSGKAEAGPGGSMIAKQSDHVRAMLGALQESFAKNLKWQVTPTDAMVKNPGYEAAYKKTMKGFQNKMPPGEGRNRFTVEPVMDFDGVRILGQPGREQLMTALGVDAIVAAKVDVHLSGTSVMGIGSRYPQSNLSFSLYVRGHEAPVWFEGQIQGEKSKQSVGSTGFTDESATSRLALESARTAFAKIGKPAGG